MTSNVSSEGNLNNPLYVIVGSRCPDDALSNRMYSGESGIYLRSLLVSAKFTKADTLLLYINEFNFEAILDQIIHCKPKCLLILGPDPVKYLNVIMDTALNRYRGKIYENLYLNSYGSSDMFCDRYSMRLYNIYTYDPYYVLHQKTQEFVNILKVNFASDIKLFKNTGIELANGTIVKNAI